MLVLREIPPTLTLLFGFSIGLSLDLFGAHFIFEATICVSEVMASSREVDSTKLGYLSLKSKVCVDQK